MEITVKNRNIKISPRKMRPVLFGLRGMTAAEALVTTKFINKKGAYFIHNLIKSAIAAAKENYLESDKVFVKAIACNEGPRIRRFIPWSKGQARRITKKLAHLVLTIESAEKDKKEIAKEDNKANERGSK